MRVWPTSSSLLKPRKRPSRVPTMRGYDST